MTASSKTIKATIRKKELRIKHVVLRGAIYWFRIAVPKHKRDDFGGKTHVWESLRTKDPDIAADRAVAARRKYKALFGTIKQTPEEMDIETFMNFAKNYLGMSYSVAVEATSTQEIFDNMGDRLETFAKVDKPAQAVVAAVGGSIKVPALTMTQALERYQVLSAEKWLNLDKRSRDKKWRPFAQAVDEFNNAMGKDVDVLKLTKAQAWEYKDELVKAIAAKKFDLATARKKLMWLRLILTKVFEVDYGRETNPFNKVVIEGEAKKGKCESLTRDELKTVLDTITSSKANDELKALNVVAAMTGATCKELCLLTSSDIHLDAPVPYISIVPNEHRHQVKKGGTRHRDIPLFGEGLKAMTPYAGTGFPRYCYDNGGEALSAASNKLIKPAVKNKTFYSYRHAMADALRNSGCGDNLKDSLLGHATEGHSMHYGSGFALENKLEALKKALPEYI